MKKFETLGVIGIGAYGIVLKAQHKETNEINIFPFFYFVIKWTSVLFYHIVAIKKFKESDQDETIRKISLREVKILKLVDHQNIVH